MAKQDSCNKNNNGFELNTETHTHSRDSSLYHHDSQDKGHVFEWSSSSTKAPDIDRLEGKTHKNKGE